MRLLKRYQIVDVVFHMAANTSNGLDTKVNPLLHVTPNVEMNTNLMEQSWRNKVRKFIFISSNTTYPDVGGEYYTEDMEVLTPNISCLKVGWMKDMERHFVISFLIKYMTPIIIIRPSNAYGPNDKYDFEKCHVTPNILEKVDGLNPIPLWGDGTEVRDVIHVDDMVSGFITGEKGRYIYIYNVCYGKDIQLWRY